MQRVLPQAKNLILPGTGVNDPAAHKRTQEPHVYATLLSHAVERILLEFLIIEVDQLTMHANRFHRMAKRSFEGLIAGVVAVVIRSRRFVAEQLDDCLARGAAGICMMSRLMTIDAGE